MPVAVSVIAYCGTNSYRPACRYVVVNNKMVIVTVYYRSF